MPPISAVTNGLPSIQAGATWARDTPRASATAATASIERGEAIPTVPAVRAYSGGRVVATAGVPRA